MRETACRARPSATRSGRRGAGPPRAGSPPGCGRGRNRRSPRRAAHRARRRASARRPARGEIAQPRGRELERYCVRRRPARLGLLPIAAVVDDGAREPAEPGCGRIARGRGGDERPQQRVGRSRGATLVALPARRRMMVRLGCEHGWSVLHGCSTRRCRLPRSRPPRGSGRVDLDQRGGVSATSAPAPSWCRRMPRVDAAEDELAQARMAVAAHDDEIGLAVGRMRQDRVGHVALDRAEPLDLDLQPVAREMLADVGAGDLVAPAGSPSTITTSTALARWRNGMASPTARAAFGLPSQHTSTRSSLSARLLDVGHDQHGTAGIEQRAPR